jgi:hypothetical protein
MNTTPLQNRSSVFKVKNLDLTTAKEVKSLADATQGECSVLDLSSFLDADLSAIEYLGQYPYDFVTLSLSQAKIVSYDKVALPFFSIELRNKD